MTASIDVLVTGSEGFVGNATVAALTAAGLNVLATDLVPHPRCPRDSYLEMDVSDREQVFAVFASVQPRAVVHLAAAMDVGGENPEELVRTNVVGSANVLNAAKAYGVKRVVYGSSVMVYGPADPRNRNPVNEEEPTNPSTLYGAAKVFVERLAGQRYFVEHMETVGLRFTTIYGPGRTRGGACPFVVDAFHAAASSKPVRINMQQTTDMIYVDDAADAIRAAIAATEILAPVYNVSHHEANGEEIVGIVRGLQPSVLIDEERSVGSTWPSVISNDRARNDLGWEPRNSLREGAEASIKWFQEEIQNDTNQGS